MMRGRWWVLSSCLLVSVLGASAVKAGGGGNIDGTITFVGEVVEPTCSLGAEQNLVSVAMAQQSRQRSCTGANPAAAQASRIYNVGVVHLSSAEPDQVLRYFANYVRVAKSGGADPVLVTQTYE
jgi:type 1 fimbria pilin